MDSCDGRGRESTISVTDASSSQQPIVDLNIVHTEEKIVGTSEECIINSSKLPQRRGGIGFDITLEELMKVDGMKRKDAAEKLKVSVSTFKRICRDYGISRWPPRNVESQSCSTISALTSCIEEHRGTVPILQNENNVTIKAKFGDKFIKFQLPASSDIDAFHHQVSKRLKLDAKDYTITYQDEDNDCIIISCDDDLRDYISSSTLSGEKFLVVMLEPT